ncbi:hypothetical protein N581_09730 [Lactobacillus jensenii MD IIE-70(2)]|nr:hypothetical protein N581_09730 [Lactobacillus jensenii MD IIE-70(2)]
MALQQLKKNGFNSAGIIAVNESFTHSEEEDPAWPGHLRNALSDPNDAIAIITDPNGTSKGAYIALVLVTISELDDIVNQFNE